MPTAAPSAAASNEADQAAGAIEIFRSGTHTAVSGQTLAFASRDLMATAIAYDPARHEAPLVVGHPTLDAPAYGWVAGLAYRSGNGGTLEARCAQVDPAFAEMVAAGRFKKISASFYAPDAPGNPAPGTYYLRHVGFLGAQPPAVKGLRTPQFAEGEPGVIEFNEWDDANNAGLWRSLREWILAKFGTTDADQAVPGWTVGALEQSAQQEIAQEIAQVAAEKPASTVIAAYAEERPIVTQEEKRALEAENVRLKAELDAALAAQRQARLATAHADHTAFAESLTQAARWPVAGKAVLVAVLDHLAQEAERTGAQIEFAEGERKAPLATELRTQLQALPASVAFGEVATAAAAGEAGSVQFAAPDGAAVDPTSLALHQRILAHQAKHAGMSYAQAVTAVTSGRA